VVVPPPEGAGEVAAAVATLPGGGLLVAGTALPSAGGTAALLLRFRPDGRLDPAFGSGAALNSFTRFPLATSHSLMLLS
jgi:hypothetical protein